MGGTFGRWGDLDFGGCFTWLADRGSSGSRHVLASTLHLLVFGLLPGVDGAIPIEERDGGYEGHQHPKVEPEAQIEEVEGNGAEQKE